MDDKCMLYIFIMSPQSSIYIPNGDHEPRGFNEFTAKFQSFAY